MTLCPNCGTIQKAGTRCTICTCPVETVPAPAVVLAVAVETERIL